MFGLFSNKTPECPLDEPTRLWLENAFIWLAEQFGPDVVKQKQILFPSVEHFPVRYDESTNSVLSTAAIVAKQMDIDINSLTIEIYREGIHAVQGSRLFTKADENSKLSSGKYFGKNENGKYDVFIEQNNLAHPEKMVATLSHEFAHIKLLGEGRLDDNDEHLTDLATVLYGLGVFNANSSFKEFSTTNTSGYYGLGYLRQQEWGYALALYAYYRNEKAPTWMKYLSPNIKSDFKKSEEYIYANTDKIFNETYKPADKTGLDNFFTGNWRGSFTYGKTYSKALQKVLFHFNLEMNVNDGIVLGSCTDDENPNNTAAIVEGFIENNYQISFTKTYSSNAVSPGKSAETIIESSPVIEYKGVFDEGEFTGKWEIKSVRADKDGAYYLHIDSGTWAMKKQ